jgi:hypothetical protein
VCESSAETTSVCATNVASLSYEHRERGATLVAGYRRIMRLMDCPRGAALGDALFDSKAE